MRIPTIILLVLLPFLVSGWGESVVLLLSEDHHDMLGYLQERSDTPAGLRDDEIRHMEDVRTFHRVAIWLLSVCLVAFFLVLTRGDAHRILIPAGKIALVLSALLLFAFAIAFTAAFTSFHSLFFAPGTWTFPADSTLVTRYPLPFWQAVFTAYFVISGLLSLSFLLIGKAYKRHNPMGKA